jgi:hypothetical protein
VVYFSFLKVQVWLEQLGIPPDADHETLDHQLGPAKKTMDLSARRIFCIAVPAFSGRKIGAIVVCQIEHPALTKPYQSLDCIVCTEAHAGLERGWTGLG